MALDDCIRATAALYLSLRTPVAPADITMAFIGIAGDQARDLLEEHARTPQQIADAFRRKWSDA